MRYLLIVLLFLTGCSFEEEATKNQAYSQFSSLCNRQDLTICKNGSAVQEEVGSIFDLKVYTYNRFNTESYRYKTDKENYGVADLYVYMSNTREISYGDCEDYAITFVEDNINNGNIGKGEASIIFGETEEGYHVWVSVIKEEERYLFDTYFIFGILQEEAYNAKEYRSMFTLYTY